MAHGDAQSVETASRLGLQSSDLVIAYVYMQQHVLISPQEHTCPSNMKSSMKRLAKDQVALRRSLPPNYLFENEDDLGLPDDLTQLLICLTGPEGTPYSQGLWRIRLDIPIEYPSSPPTATFKTRIFHPNVAEETGAVCLETLKRDWDPNLSLKDILITISCLLIQPNPDSALNQKAGALIQEDYDAFARQAKLMTRIHAPIPEQLFPLAQEAKRRGEEHDESGSVSGARGTGVLPEHAEHSILKENQRVASRNAEHGKPGSDKPLKRPLAEVSSSTDATQEEQIRRKSPKHRHPAEASTDGHRDAKHDVAVTSIDFAEYGRTSRVPEKVVFRAQWSMPLGLQTPTARIGIRRL